MGKHATGCPRARSRPNMYDLCLCGADTNENPYQTELRERARHRLFPVGLTAFIVGLLIGWFLL